MVVLLEFECGGLRVSHFTRTMVRPREGGPWEVPSRLRLPSQGSGQLQPAARALVDYPTRALGAH